MSIRKTILSAVVLLAAITPSLAQARERVMLDRVVAVVGGSAILNSEVEQYADRLVAMRREQGYTSDRDPRNEALEGLLLQRLLYNQAQIDSVEINTGGVIQRVEEQIQAMIAEAGSIAALEELHRMPIFNLRDILRKQLEEQQYAQQMRATVVQGVTVTPGETERYYNRLDKDSLPMIGEQYVYAQITKYPASRDEARRRTRERLLEIRERIVRGDTRFDTMARIYSVDGTAIRGGELDPQPLEGFVREFADALQNLKVNQVSEVVETEFGFHIIQLLDKNGDLYHCRHILLRPTYTPEEMLAPSLTLDSLARLIRVDSLSFEKAALEHSDDAYSKMNGGVVSNHDILEMYAARYGVDARMTTTKFLKEDFGMGGGKSIDDYNAIRRLKPGEVSNAFQTEDFSGNVMSKIVKLIEVIPPHRASLEEDYLQLEEMALNAKRDRIFNEWLDKKIDAMYIYIIPEMRSGEFENKHWVK